VKNRFPNFCLSQCNLRCSFKGSVIVIRYEGPKGGPGMPEMLTPTSAIMGAGLGQECALITDGRFSGGSHGFVIGGAHASSIQSTHTASFLFSFPSAVLSSPTNLSSLKAAWFQPLRL
jgi:hypothetical protein